MGEVREKFATAYAETTPTRLKIVRPSTHSHSRPHPPLRALPPPLLALVLTLRPGSQIDAFLWCIGATALIQLAYCALVGTFPFNSFLAGFLSTVGMFVLTVCLRMQVVSGTVTAQRAWAEYAVANLVLHLAVLNFMG